MQLHAVDVGLLTRDVLGAHVDHALQAEEGAREGRGGAVLAGAGLSDDALLTHALGQQCLTDHLVGLVGTTVHQILTLEEDAGITPPLPRQRQVGAFGQRGRTTEVVAEVGGEFLAELGIVGGIDEGLLQLIQRGQE